MSFAPRSCCPLALMLLIAMAAHGDVARPSTFAPQCLGVEDARRLAPLPATRSVDAAELPLGEIPPGWADLAYVRPSRNWGSDGRGALRYLEKHGLGLLAERATGTTSTALLATFSKTEDADVTVGLVLRSAADGRGYALLLDGRNELRLVRREDGQTTLLASLVLLRPYRHGERWTLWARAVGRELSGAVFDAEGRAMAQVDALDARFTTGSLGLVASEFVGFHRVELGGTAEGPALAEPLQAAAAYRGYQLVAPALGPQRPAVERTLDELAPRYDIVIAGAGTGGVCAAIQAARMGCSVLLTEETEWIGGQLSAAAVTSIDEGHVDSNYQDRERGLYREFNEAMVLYYYGLEKTPWQAYYSWSSPRRQDMGGYEPRVARGVLHAMLAAAARSGGVRLDVALRTTVRGVQRKGPRVTGVELSDSLDAQRRRKVASAIVIDATEYGDVLPLAGAQYRAGNTLSGKLNLKATPQDNTWTCVLREYPAGIPPELRIDTPPPGYERYRGGFANYVRPGPFELTSGTRMWRSYFAWRGMADTAGPLLGRASENRHTRCGINGGNDYPTTVRGLEDPAQRHREELDGIHRTLAALYYFQHEVGVPWSLAVDEGYDTEYNREMMRRRGVEAEFLALAAQMPQRPYTRESRRLVGLRTLRGEDLGRFERWRNQPHAVAIADYGVDLHRTEEFIEHDLDRDDYDRRGGPFQVPFECFVPARIDGLLAAEKNLSQSRIASGATRLQPSTMLTGQAAGAIAALAVRRGVQPRALDLLPVQEALLQAGSTLAPRWYDDVAWGGEAWRATQLLSLHEVWDVPGSLSPAGQRLGEAGHWGWGDALTAAEARVVLERLAGLLPQGAASPGLGQQVPTLAALNAWATAAGAQPLALEAARDRPATRGDLALLGARVLLRQGTVAPARGE